MSFQHLGKFLEKLNQEPAKNRSDESGEILPPPYKKGKIEAGTSAKARLKVKEESSSPSGDEIPSDKKDSANLQHQKKGSQKTANAKNAKVKKEILTSGDELPSDKKSTRTVLQYKKKKVPQKKPAIAKNSKGKLKFSSSEESSDDELASDKKSARDKKKDAAQKKPATAKKNKVKEDYSPSEDELPLDKVGNEDELDEDDEEEVYDENEDEIDDQGEDDDEGDEEEEEDGKQDENKDQAKSNPVESARKDDVGRQIDQSLSKHTTKKTMEKEMSTTDKKSGNYTLPSDSEILSKTFTVAIKEFKEEFMEKYKILEGSYKHLETKLETLSKRIAPTISQYETLKKTTTEMVKSSQLDLSEKYSSLVNRLDEADKREKKELDAAGKKKDTGSSTEVMQKMVDNLKKEMMQNISTIQSQVKDLDAKVSAVHSVPTGSRKEQTVSMKSEEDKHIKNLYGLVSALEKGTHEKLEKFEHRLTTAISRLDKFLEAPLDHPIFAQISSRIDEIDRKIATVTVPNSHKAYKEYTNKLKNMNKDPLIIELRKYLKDNNELNYKAAKTKGSKKTDWTIQICDLQGCQCNFKCSEENSDFTHENTWHKEDLIEALKAAYKQQEAKKKAKSTSDDKEDKKNNEESSSAQNASSKKM